MATVLKDLLRDVARRFGYHVERIPNGTLAWNQQVELNFPVKLRSRWGYGLPHNPHVYSVLDAQRANYERALRDIKAAESILRQIPHDPVQDDPGAPFWSNTWFTGLDAASLVGFLLVRRPKRYIEIGSGFSTRFCRRAVKAGGLDTTITSIDPSPRAEIDNLCNQVIRTPLEACDPLLFDELEPGDILFFDGSHRALPNSDVTVFFLEILPRLKPGIIVQIYDIFLPDDYPPAWSKRVYSEQYLLATMLLCRDSKVRLLLPCYFASIDDVLKLEVRNILASADVPPAYNTSAGQPACAFWFEIID